MINLSLKIIKLVLEGENSVIPLNVVDRRERKSSDLFSFLLLQGHTSCLDSDTEEDYDDIREDLGDAWKLSIGVNDFG